jgi:hypothetical protein
VSDWTFAAPAKMYTNRNMSIGKRIARQFATGAAALLEGEKMAK